MDALETAQPRAPLKALSLFGVLVLAKIGMFVGRDVPVLTLFWDDALLALLFAIVETLTRTRPRISTIIYIVLVSYAAINVPIARLTSSPLTLQMMRATGSALSDSIAHHLTPANIALMALVVTAAIALPRILRRSVWSSSFSWHGVCQVDDLGKSVRRIQFPALGRLKPELHTLRIFAFALATLLLFGAIARNSNDFTRNAFTVLFRSSIPRVQARAYETDWRMSLARQKHSDAPVDFLRGAARGRNVVVIALESTGAQYLKCYGANCDPTPNLTALARQAVVFENAYAVYPESIKGLFSVLCSRYPAFETQPADYARVPTPAIAQVARDAGYRTALFHSGRFMYLGMRSIIDRRGFEVMEDAGHIDGNHNSSFGTDEPAAVQRILEWVDSLQSGERFCLMYLPIAGHHPYEVPTDGPFAGNDERTRYLNSLHYGDAALGELLRGLKTRGKDTNTLFVIYGDHGEAFGQHDGNFGHTFFLYEENVRVPLLVAAPGLIEKAIRVSNIASLIDIAPTVTDLLGLAEPRDWQGVSLLNHRPRAALFFTDYSLPLVGIRDGPWKAIYELGARRAQIFDVTASAEETRDLAARHPALVAMYRGRLESWAAAQKSLLKP